MRFVKIATRRGAIKKDGFEIFGGSFVQPFHQIFQCFVHITHCLAPPIFVNTLPTPGGAAPSAAAAAEASESSAARIPAGTAAEASAAPAPPHPTKHRSNPPAAPPTSSSTRRASPSSRNREDNPDDEEYQPQANRRRMIRLLPVRPSWGLAGERHAPVVRNVFRQYPCRGLDGRAVVRLA